MVETPVPGDETEVPEVEETATPEIPVDVVTTNVRVNKLWEDNNDAAGLRPASITVTLYANGRAYRTATLSAPEWAYTFGDLPRDDENGNRITYTVDEVSVPFYTTTVNGTTITNTIVEPEANVPNIDVSGSKLWEDDDNAAGLRPDSIVVNLLQNGVVIDSTTVTAATGWTFTFAGVPESDGYGNVYTYTFTENPVNGYYPIYPVVGPSIVNRLVPSPAIPEVDIQDYPVARGVPTFNTYNAGELSELVDLFDYGVPLFGMLLGTGLEVPVYPFVFAGCGVLALVLAIVLSLKKKKN